MDHQKCTFCGLKLRLLQINFTEAIYACPDIKCVYPLSSPEMEFINRDFLSLSSNKCVSETEKETVLNSNPPLESALQTESKNFLDDLLADCEPVQMSEEDIQAVDSVFESLINCDIQL